MNDAESHPTQHSTLLDTLALRHCRNERRHATRVPP